MTFHRKQNAAFGFPPTVTRRGWSVLALAVSLYLFANQTQVSWLYVFTALTLGVWIVCAWLPGRMVRGVTLTRAIRQMDEAELHVGDPIVITLTLSNAARLPALHLRGEELCPFAPAADRVLPFFASAPARSTIEMRYDTVCARRGWFDFTPLTVTTRAPFGFFAARRILPSTGGVLIFPEYRVLESFPLLDRRPATQSQYARIGQGAEFLGVREYRPGDSPRHVHWRTTARAGRLVVKEFAEETQPGLTLALDVRASSVIGDEDDNTLERAIKVAATLAHYADARGIALSLPPLGGAVSRWAAMNYLARVQPDNGPPFAECLRGLRGMPFVAALLPAPDEAVIAPLLELKRGGATVLAVLFDWQADARVAALAASLKANGLSVRMIGDEVDWERALIQDERVEMR
ncbi:MAG: DUF58 domain-containing protein [Anaerolineales bacterium]